MLGGEALREAGDRGREHTMQTSCQRFTNVEQIRRSETLRADNDFHLTLNEFRGNEFRRTESRSENQFPSNVIAAFPAATFSSPDSTNEAP